MKKIYTVLLISLFTTQLSAATYYLKPSGSITTASSWGTNTNGTGTSPSNFNGQHTWVFANRTAATLNSAFNINVLATASISTGFHLTVSGTGVLAGSIKGKINIAPNATVTVGNSASFKWNVLDPASTVIYNFNGASMAKVTYGNVIINANATCAGGAGDVNIEGLLTINSGRTLTLNGASLFLYGSNGQIAGAGQFANDPGGLIIFFGSNGGNNGTLNFVNNATIGGLYLAMGDANDYVTLGTSVTVDAEFYQSTGSLDLNGNLLTVSSNGDASFASSTLDGVIRSNVATSGLIINGTIGLNNSPDMYAHATNNIFGTIYVNNPAASLGIGSPLIITDSISVPNGDISVNGNVTLRSTAALKGRLGLVGGTLSGNLNVQTFAAGGSTGWAQLGVSGIGGQTFANWYGQFPMTIEGSATGVTSAGGYFESVQGWNESSAYGYDTTLTISSPITPGRGYWIYLGTGLYTTSDIVWTVSGSPVIGNVSMPVTNSAQGGYNLLANPYPSPISWTKLRNGNNAVNNAIYVYNADGSYASFVNGVGTGGGSDVIPMGQGFFVEATGNSALNAQESNKVPQNTGANPLLKSSQVQSPGTVFRLKITDPYTTIDETAFRFHANATPVFDGEWDAHKLFQTPGYVGYPGSYSKYTSISSKDASNEDYSINSLPLVVTNSISIPVLVKVAATGVHTITPVDLQNFSNPACVVLKDKLLNVNHSLANGPYVFNISDTTSAPRFELVICPQNMVTSTGGAGSIANDNAIFIGQDHLSAFVTTNFSSYTNARISVYNIIGQKLIDEVSVSGTETFTRLNLNVQNQVVIIKVTTDKESITKKIIPH
jgi:hypothetical protein